MTIQSILLLLSLTTTLTATFPKPITYKTLYSTKYKSPAERRTLGLFPKTEKKFVITAKPIESEMKLFSKEIYSKKPLLPKLMIQNKDKESTKYFFYKEPVTRQPLMKYKKFIVKSTSLQNINNVTNKKLRGVPLDSVESSEENKDEFLDGHSNEVENLKSDEKLEKIQESIEDENFTTESEFSDVSENKRLKRDNITYTDIISYPNTSEENEDLMEFIFVNNIVPRSDDDEEFTTDSSSTHKIIKRAVNVIEEENLGTTISVFKYTGRETYLTNDLNYKNINS